MNQDGVRAGYDLTQLKLVRAVLTIPLVASGGAGLQVQRVMEDGFETVETPLPAVVTVSNELGDPRYPKLQQIMQAAKKTVTTWGAADLGLDASTVGAAGARLKLERLAQPEAGGAVQFIEGDTPEAQAQALVRALIDARII